MKNKKLLVLVPFLMVLLMFGAIPANAANTPDITNGVFRIQSTDEDGEDREAVIAFDYLLNDNYTTLKIFIELYPEDDTDEIFDSKVVTTTYNNVTQGVTAKSYSGLIYIDEGDDAFDEAAISEDDDIICRIRIYDTTIASANLLVTEYLEDEYPSLVASAVDTVGEWGWTEWGVAVLAVIGGSTLVIALYLYAKRRGNLVP